MQHSLIFTNLYYSFTNYSYLFQLVSQCLRRNDQILKPKHGTFQANVLVTLDICICRISFCKLLFPIHAEYNKVKMNDEIRE